MRLYTKSLSDGLKTGYRVAAFLRIWRALSEIFCSYAKKGTELIFAKALKI